MFWMRNKENSFPIRTCSLVAVHAFFENYLNGKLPKTGFLILRPKYGKIEKSTYSKTCLKLPLKKNTKIGFQYQLSLNADQKYCKGSILQYRYFQPSLSYHFPFRPLFCLFLSGGLRQVLLYIG